MNTPATPTPSPRSAARGRRPRWRERSERERGVALLVVITWLAMMIALVAQFTFGTSVEAAQAANARDELRAHYLARSAVNLSRLLIKIQAKFVEPVMGQAQRMLQSMSGTPATGSGANTANMATGLGISLRVTDYADLLMGFFSGSSDEVSSLGSLIGLDIKEAKGLGLKSGRFDAEITAEDAKIDLNCGAAFVNGMDPRERERQLGVFRLLNGLMFSPRYDRLFNQQDARGQFSSRVDVARALIDWADGDEQLYSPEGAAGPEDYGYDAQKDKYRAHDGRYDSLDEIKLVRGVTDEFLEAFGPYLTVYPTTDANTNAARRCRLNLSTLTNRMGGDCAPLMMGIVRATAIADPSKLSAVDPSIIDDKRLYPIATVLCDRASAAGFDSLDAIIKVAAKPEAAVMPDDPRYRVFQGMPPLKIDPAALDLVAYVGPARTYKIVATGQSGKVRKKITAVVDTGRSVENPLSQNYASEQAAGVIQYWREE